jgi:hypothetical protein
VSYTPTESESGLSPDAVRLLINGFSQLKEGSLYMIIGTLLAALGLIAIFPTMPHGRFTVALAGASTALILALIGEIIALLGLVRWRHGGEYFKQFDPAGMSSGASGPKYMLWGVGIIIIALLILIPAALTGSMGLILTGISVAIIGGLIYLIGYILFGIFLLKLEDIRYKGLMVPDFKIDAIIWFIGIVINLLTFVAVILIYVHAKEAEEKLTYTGTPYRPPPMPSSF